MSGPNARLVRDRTAGLSAAGSPTAAGAPLGSGARNTRPLRDVLHVVRFRRRRFSRLGLLGVLALALSGSLARAKCPAERDEPQVPTDLALCASLDPVVRRPGALPLNVYEAKLGTYLRHYCHRNRDAGWRSDKRVRDTGPFIAEDVGDHVVGKAFGTHAPVLVWYSPEMMTWLKVARGGDRGDAAGEPTIPDGAMMVKEMYPAPASACASTAVARLLPTGGAAVMIRDNAAAWDGWFWGWFGWNGWTVDWPAAPTSGYPNMGFGQYCVNCHASARENQTFSSLRNIAGEPGEPLAYLSQDVTSPDLSEEHHKQVAQASEPAPRAIAPGAAADVLASLGLGARALPKLVQIEALPPATYDNVWARAKGHSPRALVTSDQCLGCHDAASTGLQFDMTEKTPRGLVNVSPYGTWRSSPMGLSGRDPVFYAQLESETARFHPGSAALIEGTCFGCHGVLGQRALHDDAKRAGRACTPLSRATIAITPFESGDPLAALAEYAGLARDGVSCVACHEMALGAEASAAMDAPQNGCLQERRASLTPGLTGLAASFTGSFAFRSGTDVGGPFEHPREMPMRHALGMKPVYDAAIGSSELCASCHVVHLPILRDGQVVGQTYEQTTYAEWAFSAYRTGLSPDGPLPEGAGANAQSCQDCHMPSRDGDGRPVASKVASIQEYSNFPQTENNLGPADLDLPARSPYAKHTLVGLNTFLVEMARQFPELLGLRARDPMLSTGVVEPLVATEQAMLDQAHGKTADVRLHDLGIDAGALRAAVTITNHTGHKFPSGVGFRRAFVTFTVRDGEGRTLWVSGQTNKAGVILDGQGKPLDGEYWWTPDCRSRIDPLGRRHQPHHEVITRQDEVQIYEDVAAAPEPAPPGAVGTCDKDGGDGPLTTSFLSRCRKVKDNRILPAGFLDLDRRAAVAAALGANRDLALEAGAVGVGDDPDYRSGGRDILSFRVPLTAMAGTPASVEAELFYQPMPPYYLQDRACTSSGADADRLLFMAGNLNLDGGASAGWKLRVATSGAIRLR